MRSPFRKVFVSKRLSGAGKKRTAAHLKSIRGRGMLFKRLAPVLLFASLILLPLSSQAQQQSGDDLKALKKEIEALKQGQIAIQKELQEIKGLLLAKQASNSVEPLREIVIDTAGAPFKGERKAKLTLIEFSDYQCPFCSRYVRETLPQIERDYVKTGKVKYVFLEFPIESIHQNALIASQAAYCAGEQGKYWEMHDRLFSNQSALGPGDMLQHAKAIEIDSAKFQRCLESKKYQSEIRQRVAEAINFGVTGTPTFFLGVTNPNDSKVRVVTALSGAKPYANFKELIDSLLFSRPSQPSQR